MSHLHTFASWIAHPAASLVAGLGATAVAARATGGGPDEVVLSGPTAVDPWETELFPSVDVRTSPVWAGSFW